MSVTSTARRSASAASSTGCRCSSRHTAGPTIVSTFAAATLMRTTRACPPPEGSRIAWTWTCTAVACSCTSTPSTSRRPDTVPDGTAFAAPACASISARAHRSAQRRTGGRSIVATGEDARSSAASPSMSTASRRRPGSASRASRVWPAAETRSWSTPRQPVTASSASQDLHPPRRLPAAAAMVSGSSQAARVRPRAASSEASRASCTAPSRAVRAPASADRCSSATDPAVTFPAASAAAGPSGVAATAPASAVSAAPRSAPSRANPCTSASSNPSTSPRASSVPGGVAASSSPSCTPSISGPYRSRGTSASRRRVRWCRAAPGTPGGAGSG